MKRRKRLEYSDAIIAKNESYFSNDKCFNAFDGKPKLINFFLSFEMKDLVLSKRNVCRANWIFV